MVMIVIVFFRLLAVVGDVAQHQGGVRPVVVALVLIGQINVYHSRNPAVWSLYYTATICLLAGVRHGRHLLLATRVATGKSACLLTLGHPALVVYIHVFAFLHRWHIV